MNLANATRATRPSNPVQVIVNAEQARSTTVVPREKWTREAHVEGWNNKAKTPMKSRSDDDMRLWDQLEANVGFLEGDRYQKMCEKFDRCNSRRVLEDEPAIA